MTGAGYAIVILFVSVTTAVCQTASKGGIQGVVKDDSGKAVAGAVAVATGAGTASQTMTFSVTGKK
jgi:hypothetical protein